MTYTVRNLTSRLLCLHGSSGASYYIHAKKSLDLEDIEIKGNASVDKLIRRNIVRIEHHAAKATTKATVKAKSNVKTKAKAKSKPKSAPASTQRAASGAKVKKRATA